MHVSNASTLTPNTCEAQPFLVFEDDQPHLQRLFSALDIKSTGPTRTTAKTSIEDYDMALRQVGLTSVPGQVLYCAGISHTRRNVCRSSSILIGRKDSLVTAQFRTRLCLFLLFPFLSLSSYQPHNSVRFQFASFLPPIHVAPSPTIYHSFPSLCPHCCKLLDILLSLLAQLPRSPYHETNSAFLQHSNMRLCEANTCDRYKPKFYTLGKSQHPSP